MTVATFARRAVLFLLPIAGACSDGAPAASQPDAASAPDFVAEAVDFECLQSWNKVRSFRITNKLGDVAGALAVADAP